MSINVERLRTELEWITAHPEQWEQAVWAQRTSCGTSCCLAGWTVVHEGIPLGFPAPSGLGQTSATEDGRHIPEVAQEILGLDFEDADWLFEVLL